MNGKHKIIGKSNFNLENISDILIAENLTHYWGKKIEKALCDTMNENDTYYYYLVDQDYELYVFNP